MVNAYIGQIFMFAFDWAPKNYQTCSAQVLSIQQNAALFSILGTNYGGNGQTTFGLPDLRGRTHMGTGQGPGLSDYVLGQQVGIQTVTLTQNNLPQHNHPANVNNAAATVGVPTGAVLSKGPIVSTSQVTTYSTAAANGSLNAGALANTGNGQPFSVLQPYLAINFSMCQFGLFPSRN